MHSQLLGALITLYTLELTQTTQEHTPTNPPAVTPLTQGFRQIPGG